uniref:t-SNARE coiled-coil homology domain-containing protein n=1 Tax=Ananas comosus var. bracteatus TaxID=296719 RepID=A0A6V7PSW5_ANACO|nr:unnamed protein product [Ananas comosus var. bracteatus]
MSAEVERIDGEIQDILRALRNGFQKLDKITDSNRQLGELEKLTIKMKKCKLLIREFDNAIEDAEIQNPPEVNCQLVEKKQLMVGDLTLFLCRLVDSYKMSLGNKKDKGIFDMGSGGSDHSSGYNLEVVSAMSNSELIYAGRKRMDEIDQAIEHSKTVVEQTIEVGGQSAATLKAQTEHLGRIVDEMDTAQFSIKKASRKAKELGRKVATDKCFMLFLFMIICGGIVIMLVKV